MAIFTRALSGSLRSLNSAIGLSPSSAIGPEHEVLMDDHAQRPTRPGGNRRLDVEVLLGNALAGLLRLCWVDCRSAQPNRFNHS